MRISVVIATYNRSPLLRDCLEQLRLQRYEPGDEVIVVDNASTDPTSDVIRRAAAGFPASLQHLREPTPGKPAALNAGIAAARGDILALTDDDVLVADDWIPTMRRLFEDPTLALVGGRIDPRWERPAPRWLRVEHGGRYDRMTSPLALLHYGEAQALGARTAVGGNMAIRRDVFDAVGGFPSHLGRRRGTLMCGEDHDLCQRAVAAGYRCEYRPELRVRHWVPAERARLSYYLRWFFWSGVTHAVLNADERTDPRALTWGAPAYVWRRLVTAPVAAAGRLLAGRHADAAAEAVDAAYAFGYLTQRLRGRRNTFGSAERPTGGFAGSTGAADRARAAAPAEPPRALRCERTGSRL